MAFIKFIMHAGMNYKIEYDNDVLCRRVQYLCNMNELLAQIYN